jgi:ribosomal RNA assembly protein
METILIPKERAGVINKKVIQKIKDELDIVVVRRGNAVEVDGEGVEYLLAKNIVIAISRGFSPVRAYRLLDEEQELQVIELGKHAQRIRSRLIGTKGKCRKRIEYKTGAAISVYGKTVAVIGNWEELKLAVQSVQMLIDGTSHNYVYRWLEDTCETE